MPNPAAASQPRRPRANNGRSGWRIASTLFLSLASWALPASAAPARKGIFGTMEGWIVNSKILNDVADRDPEAVLGVLVSGLLSLLGVAFMLLIIYGGYLWMTARGAEDQITRAKKIIGSATLGLAIVLAAYLISFIVIQLLTAQTQPTT